MSKSKSNSPALSIGDAAAEVQLPTKTVRYYDEIKLVSPVTRSTAGYRLYGSAELQKLKFVRRARSFGFSVNDCRQLLDLFENHDRNSREVKELARKRLADIETKMRDMQKLHTQLTAISEQCPGNEQANCPILNTFADTEAL